MIMYVIIANYFIHKIIIILYINERVYIYEYIYIYIEREDNVEIMIKYSCRNSDVLIGKKRIFP